MKHIKNQVEVWNETITIPTYGIGKPDKNPMFLEKRVYQGSSGKVYPCPVIDKIYDEKEDKTYNAVWLENDYLKVMILPELGGRIQRAYDKTNDYDFVYYNEVIKPALVGLAGPWISGGIEFNWPQHHRPTTFSPVDYSICENSDGSKTVKLSDTDPINGTKSIASITLHTDKAYIEIKGELYNPTPLPQTFLWWANPAVAVNDNTQSIFPPDVIAVMDHGKRAVSKFPIATGEYYKHDYSEGVDISRYKNLPVPTSYMAYHSEFDFVGGYDYGVGAGILHIADHHVSPGKKQWTWGCGDFGQAWDRNLTDENGPYIELMTGMYTDNQPDFTWLKPYEQKEFVQYFMPYKKVADVKNANTDVALNFKVEDGKAYICVYGTGVFENAKIVLNANSKEIMSETKTISPIDVFEKSIEVNNTKASEITLSVYDNTGKLLIDYTPAEPKIEKMPESAKAAKKPEEIMTNEELLLTGLHIEQYRHATYLPDGYYLKGLKRDPCDSRINVAYGQLLLRRGNFTESVKHFETAIKRLTKMNPNPYNSEAYYYMGIALKYQGKDDKAFDAFYKAIWTNEQQEMSFYNLACISAKQAKYKDALNFVDRSLVKNSKNTKARALKAIILSKIGKQDKALELLKENIEINPFDYISIKEYNTLTVSPDAGMLALIGNKPQTFIDCAISYASWGFYTSAIKMLDLFAGENPMIHYYKAMYYGIIGDNEGCQTELEKANLTNSLYCFPNTLDDIVVLEYAISHYPEGSKAYYYLGNIFYDKRQFSNANKLWEKSAQLNDEFPTVWRNLALSYYNKQSNPEKAQDALERAFELDKTDARVFLELDQLYKKIGITPQKRIEFFDKYPDVYVKRDDLLIEYITLLNLLGRYEQAYNIEMSNNFHPWEGGEGKITSQYVISLLEMGRKEIKNGDAKKAIETLKKALYFPHNLGEGKLEGKKDNDIYYYIGVAYEMIGEHKLAVENWNKATLGSIEPAGMMYYNDQPADMILYMGLAYRKLGNEAKALSCFHKLVDYGQEHIFDNLTIDYFAVSLPDLALFEDDLDIRNKAHCYYLIALGNYGLGNIEKAQDYCLKTINIDCAHNGAVRHLTVFSSKEN